MQQGYRQCKNISRFTLEVTFRTDFNVSHQVVCFPATLETHVPANYVQLTGSLFALCENIVPRRRKVIQKIYEFKVTIHSCFISKYCLFNYNADYFW